MSQYGLGQMTVSAASHDSCRSYVHVETFHAIAPTIAIRQACEDLLTAIAQLIMDESKTATPLIDEEINYLWENISVLYHGYEWQEAASEFEKLSNRIENLQRRSFCLLNAAMIAARLGDYDLAGNYLNTSIQDNIVSMLTLFLLGIVAYELEDYAEAEYYFELCYEEMEDEVNYSEGGLCFLLERNMLHGNLQAARMMSLSTRMSMGMRYPIHTIPAGLIFEVPHRHALESIAEGEGEKRLSALPEPLKIKAIHRPSPLQLDKVSSFSLSSDYSSRQWPFSRSWITRERERAIGLENQIAPQYALSTIVEGLTESPIRPSSSLTSERTKRQSWKGRPKTPYVARDARVRTESTRELAKFFRTGNPAKVMEPKDARGEHHPVEELSNFVKVFAPDNPQTRPAAPFNLDPKLIAEKRLADILNKTYDEPVPSETKKDSFQSNSPISPISMVSQNHPSLSRSSTTTTPTLPTITPTTVKAPEILQPTVYGGQSTIPRSSLSSSESRKKGREPPPVPPPRRNIPVKVTEKKPPNLNKPLPAEPDGWDDDEEDVKSVLKESRRPSPVSTVDFFTRVLSRERKLNGRF